jgi:acetyl-CoA carboxylase biotin carboxyl carrier protein
MTDADPKPASVFDLDRIRQLIELMKEHELSELDLREAEQQIRLARAAHPGALAPVVHVTPPLVGPRTTPDPGPEEHIVYIKSPMVGTFYSRPNPNAEPYLKVGDYVDESKVVCIIEAMKVFNEIPAEVRGRVLAVLVNDEEPVDFGKQLFKIDTSK